jgi:XTP/dITP diphosphohydrolase
LKAVLASHNLNKLRELSAGLPGWELELLGADEFPPELGETYYENALAKAQFGRGLRDGAWVLGEDSGLEVEALGGAPGLRSARYAPEGAEAVAKLIEELAGIESGARYVCELVGLSPEGEEVRGTGILEGRIASEARGSEGFGYDPVFVPAGEEQTVAELGNEWKAGHSHRARAARALRDALG